MHKVYREAGPTDAQTLLLLHGFPSASHMFRDLVLGLADRFHVIAPDLPGFGQSDMPDRSAFTYTWHPERVAAIISQNGNAYAEGLSDGWKPIRAYWEDPSQTNRDALRAFLAPETTVWQYTHGVPDTTRVSPDGYSLDNFYLARPGANEVQPDLFGDYKSNVALYPAFQEYFRAHKPRFLAAWGRNDPFFLSAGAEAFKRDIPNTVVRFFETGHFALETHAAEIAAAIRDFLASGQSCRTPMRADCIGEIRRARQPGLQGNSGAGAQTRCIRAGVNRPTRRR
jgi:pimeloyl-ACP methyl ester carboxylesterase